jgi:hypothetical protein
MYCMLRIYKYLMNILSGVNKPLQRKLISFHHILGARGSIVVKALYYKPEGRGFETRRSE